MPCDHRPILCHRRKADPTVDAAIIGAAPAARSAQSKSATGFPPPLSDIRKIALGCYVKSQSMAIRRHPAVAAVARWVVPRPYTETVRTSSDPRPLQANPKAFAASESANKRSAARPLVADLTFGIPGDSDHRPSCSAF